MLKAGSGLSFDVKEPVSVKLSSFDVEKNQWSYEDLRDFDVEEMHSPKELLEMFLWLLVLKRRRNSSLRSSGKISLCI